MALVNAINAYAYGQIDSAQRALGLARASAVSNESNQLGLEAYRRMIEAGIGGRIMPERRSLVATLGYQEYLEKLIEYRSANPALYAGDPTARLHVVGDSHTLSPAHTRVSLDSIEHRVVAHPVIGAKAWHLAPDVNPAITPQRKAFERLATGLPAGEPTIAMFDEIDCRASEGLFPFLDTHPEHDREQYCRGLAESYVGYLSATLRANERRIMVCGVPAPHPIQAHKVGETSHLFVDLVRLFNRSLGEAAHEAGLVFLDSHNLTAADDGIATGDRHLDTIHLLPAVFQELLCAARSESGRYSTRL